MRLTLESGTTIDDPTEDDLLLMIEDEAFVILESRDYTYIQCALTDDDASEYVLEYQDGSLDRHYHAIDEPITLERVTSAFIKYLLGDPTWLTDFKWEKMEL
ncbi:MAG: hypothetical protein U0744_04435 [Gemmataceae bacterium]